MANTPDGGTPRTETPALSVSVLSTPAPAKKPKENDMNENDKGEQGNKGKTPAPKKNFGYKWKRTAAGIAALSIAVMLGLAGITYYFSGNGDSGSNDGKVIVEPPTVITLKCDGSMGFYMGPASGHQHGVLSVDYIGDDEYWDKTPVENFTIRPVWPDSNGNCRVGTLNKESKKWELSGPALTASILDQVLDGTRPNGSAREDEILIVTCHAELSNDDCRIDAKPGSKQTAKTTGDVKSNKVSDDQTLLTAKAALVQISLALKTAEEALGATVYNTGLLEFIAAKLGIDIEGNDIDKDEGDKPES